jgi:cobalt/nickel transport system permease protein
MHIPDGYLSPASAGVLYVAALPFWYRAGQKVKSIFGSGMLPMMALMSAFCFVIQMINIPLPGGTTGHAVGASLAAIVLTPWPAVISVSIALTIQALFFGDGGITAIGANCFNMAIVQVFVSIYIYRMIPGKKRGVAAAIAGYLGINVAALLTGIELGIQPLISHAPDGTPLHAPYPLSVSIPAMMIGHLFAGFAEAAVAAAGITYLIRSNPEMLQFAISSQQHAALSPGWNKLRKIWIVLAVLVFLTPIGLLAPGTAWGEWSSEQLKEIGLGFVPAGLKKWENIWSSVFADYSIPGMGEKTGYVLSAATGVILIFLVYLILTKIGKLRETKTSDSSG